MKRLLIVVGVAAALTACASAGPSARQSAAASGDANSATADAGAGNEKICKSTPITGSRTMKRVCHTRDEWTAMRENGSDSVRRTLREAGGVFDGDSAGDYGPRPSDYGGSGFKD